MYELVRSSHFDRRLTKFLRAHPELRQRVGRVLSDLEADPNDPRLQLHALKGTIEGKHAVRVTYEYRIILTIAMREREITLIDIGGHDEVYR